MLFYTQPYSQIKYIKNIIGIFNYIYIYILNLKIIIGYCFIIYIIILHRNALIL